MKKFLLSLILCLFSALHMFAQTYEGAIPGDIKGSFIPRIYTSDNTSKFVRSKSTDGTTIQYTIYNDKFEIEKQFELDLDIIYVIFVNGTSQKLSVDLNLYDLDEYKYTDSEYLGVKITQTLFNDDEKYEILTSELIDIKNPVHIKNYKIISEDGNTLKIIEPENGYNFYSTYPPDLVKINDNFYLAIKAISGENGITFFYRIDKSTSSIQLVAKMPLNVSPTIALQSDIITVELGENNNAKEIDVVNASGQLVKRVPVTPGQKSVSFNAQGITRGVNMVHVPGENNNATKIIIK